MTGPPNLAKAAAWYADRGWPVFPLIPRDKKPLTEHGLKDASTDKVIIGRWWQDQPQANIGVVMGDASGLFTVDIDGADGRADWAALESEHGAVASTVEAETSNGRHLVFRKPPQIEIRNSASKIGRNIDVRGSGGYIAVAPSIHPSGRPYRWTEGHRPDQVAVAEAPAWLIDLVRKKEEPPPPNGHGGGSDHRMDAYASKALADELADMARTPEGQRNDALNCAAFNLGTLIGAGMIDRGVVERALTGAALASGLGQIEAERTIRSGIEAGILTPREVPERRRRIGENSPAAPLSADADWPAPISDDAKIGLPGDFLGIVGPHSEADPQALLIQYLLASGSAVGRNPHFMAERSRHGVNLFAVLVAETASGRKGTSWEHPKAMLIGVDQTWAARVQSGLSSGEGLITHVRDKAEKQQEVREKGRVVGVETVVTDEGVSDKRLLVYEAEFSSVLRVAQREGNTLSPIIRSAWETGDLQTMTKHSPTRATGAHISIVGHITRDELLRHLSDTEVANGMANRILWVLARRSKRLPDGGTPPPAAMEELRVRTAEALAFARQVGEMKRDENARALWHREYARLTDGRAGLLGCLTGRAAPIVMRVACLYALLDKQRVITEEHLRAGLAVWDYCERSVEFIFGDRLGDPTADMILSALRNTPEGMTRTDISSLLFGRNTSSGELSRALGVLLVRGLARKGQEKEAGAGRPTERWWAISR